MTRGGSEITASFDRLRMTSVCAGMTWDGVGMAGIEGIEIATHTAYTRNDKIAGMTWGGVGPSTSSG